MEYTMYDTLLQLPLFQGMSKSDLSEVLDKVRLHFQKFAAGEEVIRQGEICNKLVFVLNGELAAETTAKCGLFSFVEVMDLLTLLEPASLFGLNPRFKSTYTALTEVGILTIDKEYIYSVFNRYEVFRMNVYNILSNRAEQMYDKVWNMVPQELEGRLIDFIKSLCTNYKGTKILKIKMEDLASLMDDTRLNVSSVLNKWQNEKLIDMHRKEFVFPDVNRLQAI